MGEDAGVRGLARVNEEELAALYERWREAVEAGWSVVRSEDDRGVTPQEFHRLLLEVTLSRAEREELREKLFRAFIAGCTLSRTFSNAEIERAFERWHAGNSPRYEGNVDE